MQGVKLQKWAGMSVVCEPESMADAATITSSDSVPDGLQGRGIAA